MTVNYLPFARREYLTASVDTITLGAGIFLYRMGRIATRISALAYGRGVKAHLGELEVILDTSDWRSRDYTGPDSDIWSALSMRIGILGRGYLTENFHPVNGYCNGPTHECGTWLFPKPYTINPGQRLSAKFIAGPAIAACHTRAAVQFNGRRVLDGKPILLWDVADTTATTAGETFFLNQSTLQCPADSPVELHSVTAAYDPFAHRIGNPTWSQMLYYADGERMWEDETWPNMIDLKNNCIDLNKPQWVLNTDEVVTLEFEILPDPGVVISNPGAQQELVPVITQSLNIQVTLRGSLEVIQ